MTLRIRIDGPPTEDALRDLGERARAEGETVVVVETSHEAGEAWIRAGFSLHFPH